jgi:hypothetical protein
MGDLRTLSFSLSPIKTPRGTPEVATQKKAAVKFTPAAMAAGKEKPNIKPGEAGCASPPSLFPICL